VCVCVCVCVYVSLGGWVSSEAAGVASPDYLVRTVELKKSRECGLEQGYKKQRTEKTTHTSARRAASETHAVLINYLYLERRSEGQKVTKW